MTITVKLTNSKTEETNNYKGEKRISYEYQFNKGSFDSPERTYISIHSAIPLDMSLGKEFIVTIEEK